jgi:hypothetical protein
MAELGEGEGFLAKAAAGFIAGEYAGRKDLDGDGAFESFVAGAIDGAHTAGAEGLR